MAIVVYTANIGGYDEMAEPVPFDGVGYVAFSDNGAVPDGWQTMPVQRLFPNNGKADALRFKTMPHAMFPDADAWVWIDANMRLLVHPDRLLAFASSDGIAAFPHYKRKCIYHEAAVLMDRPGVDPLRVRAVCEWLWEVDYPPHSGLAETGVVVRMNTKKIQQVNDYWWNRTMSFQTWRDQLTFNPSLWIHGLDWGRLPGDNVRQSPWFEYRDHR